MSITENFTGRKPDICLKSWSRPKKKVNIGLTFAKEDRNMIPNECLCYYVDTWKSKQAATRCTNLKDEMAMLWSHSQKKRWSRFKGVICKKWSKIRVNSKTTSCCSPSAITSLCCSYLWLQIASSSVNHGVWLHHNPGWWGSRSGQQGSRPDWKQHTRCQFKDWGYRM